MKQVYLIGATSFTKNVIDAFLSRSIVIRGIFDNHKTNSWYGYPIISQARNIQKYVDPVEEDLFCCYTEETQRNEVVSSLPSYVFPNCIHSSAIVSHSARIGKGNYIGPLVIINPDVTIGDFNILNSMCVVENDKRIYNFQNLYRNKTLYNLHTMQRQDLDVNYTC